MFLGSEFEIALFAAAIVALIFSFASKLILLWPFFKDIQRLELKVERLNTDISAIMCVLDGEWQNPGNSIPRPENQESQRRSVRVKRHLS